MPSERFSKELMSTLRDIGTVYLAPNIPPEKCRLMAQGKQLDPERVWAVVDNEELDLRIVLGRGDVYNITARRRLGPDRKVLETRRLHANLYCAGLNGRGWQGLRVRALDGLELPGRVAERLREYFNNFFGYEPPRGMIECQVPIRPR